MAGKGYARSVAPVIASTMRNSATGGLAPSLRGVEHGKFPGVRRPDGVAATDERRCSGCCIDDDGARPAIDGEAIPKRRPGDSHERHAVLVQDDLGVRAIGTCKVDVAVTDEREKPIPERVRRPLADEQERDREA